MRSDEIVWSTKKKKEEFKSRYVKLLMINDLVVFGNTQSWNTINQMCTKVK